MMTDEMGTDRGNRSRASSPALSDISELTDLSRSPSPVPQYNDYASPRKFRAAFGTHAEPASLGEKGGFGALDVLPIELRQEIYGLAFGVDEPVTVKECCNPDMSERKRRQRPKHGRRAKAGAGRFNILQVSKAMREEAMWVVFGRGSLLLNTEDYMSKYFCGWRSKSLRGISSFMEPSAHNSPIWNTVNQFRAIKIEISEEQLQYGNPYIFIDRLVCMVLLLCREQEQDLTAPRSVEVNLGSFFHQMLPFNEQSQLGARFGEYLDWLYVHSDTAHPDHDKLAEGVAHNLQRLATIIGKHSGRDQWKIFAKAEIDEEDEGGAKALWELQVGCAQHGVEFFHLEG